jgi:hypothetical protein
MAITDPTDMVEGSTGFINATISVLGPDDELPVKEFFLFLDSYPRNRKNASNSLF